jgi:Ca2+-binding EF-hand superfamily protein
VFKTQFTLASADKGQTIKKEDMMKVMKGCGQNPQPNELETAIKLFKFETKTHLTLEEGYKVAQHLWVQFKNPQQQQPPSQPVKNNNLNFLILFCQ